MNPWGQFVRDNIDKILLGALFLLMVGVVVHMTHHQADASNVAWGREQTGTVLGALLGLITGKALSRPKE